MTIKSDLKTLKNLHDEFYAVKKQVYDKCDFDIIELNAEDESQEYGACKYKLNGNTIRFRVSKITPTKTGQFVTIWKRNSNGVTESFDSADEIDFIVITARNGYHFGQFIFPKSILIDKGIMSKNGKGGKRGIRVYAPWDEVTSKQAERTQQWQTKYFVSIKEDNSTDLELVKKLLTNN
jgi:hypothetical protein